MKKVLVIVGPTAVGKSDLSLALAKVFDGEIISGDSIQVYKGLDIGSGKVNEGQRKEVKHYMLDILSPKDTYSVYDFQKMARQHIEDITSRGKLPIVVGGTGLYIKALLYDYTFAPVDELDYSKYELMDNEELYQQLQEVDYASSACLHPNNRRRIVRALALADVNQKKSKTIEGQKKEILYDAFIIGCTTDRSILYERINERVAKMFQEGLLEEVQSLLKQGVRFDDQSMQGIGYRQFKGYVEQEKTLEEVRMEIASASRKFAKRQYTWFNNQMHVQWFDPKEEYERIVEVIQAWYNS